MLIPCGYVESHKVHAVGPNEVVYQQVDTSVEFGESDEQSEKRVPQVHCLKSSTEVINTLSKSEHWGRGERQHDDLWVWLHAS